ncbi:MAG: hypothetical protein ABI835_17185 [Chloroflexota bacterium]
MKVARVMSGGLVVHWNQRQSDQRDQHSRSEGESLRGSNAALAPHIKQIDGEDRGERSSPADEQEQAEVSLGERKVVGEHSGAVYHEFRPKS